MVSLLLIMDIPCQKYGRSRSDYTPRQYRVLRFCLYGGPELARDLVLARNTGLAQTAAYVAIAHVAGFLPPGLECLE